MEIKCQLSATDDFLLQILLLAQHVSGTTMPIIRNSRVLYRWLLPVVYAALVFKLSVWCGDEGYVYISYHIISYHIISYHIISYHIISYHIISYHIISYHNLSYISYHILFVSDKSKYKITQCILIYIRKAQNLSHNHPHNRKDILCVPVRSNM